MSFSKNMGRYFSNKCSQKLLDRAKKSITDTIKIAETTGDLLDIKTARRILSASKPSQKLHPQNNLDEKNIPKERYISPEKREQIIDELRLIV